MNGIFEGAGRQTKRFVLLFSESWREESGGNHYKFKASPSWHEYDTLEEAEKEIALMKEVYKDQLLPENHVTDGKPYHYPGDITNGGKWWGYALLDYEKERVIQSGGSGYKISEWDTITKKSNTNLKFLDSYFRKPGEVPEGYKWDWGEYDGWLQFRWGDGKNAVDYKEKKKKSLGKPFDGEEPEIEEETLVEEEILRRNGWT